MAFDTVNKFRAIQTYSAPLVLRNPEPDGAYDEIDEFALVDGLYPLDQWPVTAPDVGFPADEVEPESIELPGGYGGRVRKTIPLYEKKKYRDEQDIQDILRLFLSVRGGRTGGPGSTKH